MLDSLAAFMEATKEVTIKDVTDTTACVIHVLGNADTWMSHISTERIIHSYYKSPYGLLPFWYGVHYELKII